MPASLQLASFWHKGLKIHAFPTTARSMGFTKRASHTIITIKHSDIS